MKISKIIKSKAKSALSDSNSNKNSVSKRLEELKQTKSYEIAKETLTGNRITVGVGTCGLSAGAKDVYDALDDAKLSHELEGVGCVGMCHAEPIVMTTINGKTNIYGNVKKEDMPEFIDAINKNEIYEKRFLAHKLEELPYYKSQKRVVLKNCGFLDPKSLSQYLFVGGYEGLKYSLNHTSENVIEDITTSGLRGRGGAGFPTGKKWSFIANKKGKKYLVCNGDEGDPGAFMNRTILESDPFSIIEGMTIGAYATGTDEGVIYTRAEYPLAIKTLQHAIDIANENNLLGKDILGIKGFNFKLRIMKGAGAFVCGEETALINSIEGLRGNPSPKPPFPAQEGLFKKPTVVNNVGTWANVSTILRMGINNYIKLGSKKTKGTKILCLTGKVERSGVLEVPFGISIKKIINDIGGGVPKGTTFKGVLTGGPSGGCIPLKDLNTPLDYEEMNALGTIMGSGGFIVLNDHSCIVNIAKFFLTFTQEESCGKCTPCREGTKRLLELLTRVTKGTANLETLEEIKHLSHFVKENSLCGLGQFASNPILSTLKNFEKEYLDHIKNKKCVAGVCENLLTYEITKDCRGCGLCSRNCPVNAISGEPKKQYVIDQSKCIKCGKCFTVCPFKTITKS